MNTKQIIAAFIVLLTLTANFQSSAQPSQRHRSVTINQVVVDGKVVSADTIITETDTTTRTINSKEVSMELPYTKGTTVFIENTYRKVVVRPSMDNKVRLTTTVYYYGDSSFTNAQWLEKTNIHMQTTDSGITIKSGNITSNAGRGSVYYTDSKTIPSGVYYSYPSYPSPAMPIPPTATAPVGIQGTGVGRNESLKGSITTSGNTPARGYSTYNNQAAVFNEQGSLFYSSGLKKELTIYLPAGAALDVTSKYADVLIDHDVSAIKATITSALLDMANAGTAVIKSIYGNISTGNIDKATISLTSGKLRMKSISQLHLVTQYTKVEADYCRTLNMQSVSDDYDIGELKELSGEKVYGNLRIEKFTGSVNLKASSADIKFRTIEPTVSAITIDNKYADIRLPVSALKNYEVAFSGQYSSVFAPFERKDATLPGETSVTPVTTTGHQVRTTVSGYRVATTAPGIAAPHRNNNFTASVGDVKKAHTVFTLTCISCNVDFK